MTTKISRVSLTARVVPTLKKALEAESRQHGQTTSNYVESILLSRGEAISDDSSIPIDLQEQLKVLQAENESLKEKLETSIPEGDLIEEQENAIHREQQYQTRINELNEHIERLMEKEEDLVVQEQYAHLAMEKDAIEMDNEQLQAQLNNLQTQLREARNSHDHFSEIETKYLQLQESEKSFRIANQNLVKQIEQLKEEAEINEGAMDQLALMNEETRGKYTAQVTELEQQLQAFYDTGYEATQIDDLGDEIEALHTRVEELEEQAIERTQLHKAEIASLNELIETLELEMEDDDIIDPDYVEDLENSIVDYKAQVTKLKEALIQGEDEIYLDLTTEQSSEIEGYLEKLRSIYDGRTNEELILGALYCGVENERAFFRKLLGDYFER